MTTKLITKLIAAVLILDLPGAAWAQRRRAEPEVNPQFQQDLDASAPSDAGGPIAPEPETGERLLEDPDAPAPAQRNVQSVQIGAAPNRPNTPAGPTNPLDTRVTVRVKEAPLATFLDTISAQAKVNFIITEGLESKRITAFLQNVTVREALQILLEIKGLTYQQIGKSNTYIVSPRSRAAPNRITRIYTLSYIPLVPLNTAEEGAGKTGYMGTAAQTQGVSGPGASSGGGGENKVEQKDSEVMIMSILRSVLSKDGKVTVDPRTNAIIITDIAEVFPNVEQIISELDKRAPQVMIEAQIVEINSDRAQQLGLEWGGPTGELARFIGPQRDTAFPLDIGKPSNAHFFPPIGGFIPGIQSGGGAGGGGEGESVANTRVVGQAVSTIKMGVLDLSQLTVVLRALVTRAEARFLGKPKILTLNNKTAAIQIVRDQVVGLSVNQSQSGTGGGNLVTITAERRPTGLHLRVTPQVNKEGYVTLLLQPSFTNALESPLSAGSQRFFDPIVRSASTMVRVKNGQTLVVGGLLSSRESKIVRKVPLLGYIPIIGWLFTSTATDRSNTDLVLFITPTVVGD